MGKMKRLSEETKAAIRAAFVKGAKTTDIAAMYGISEPTAHWHKRVALGRIPAGRSGRAAQPKSKTDAPAAIPADDKTDRLSDKFAALVEQLNADILAGASDAELIAKYGVNENQVSYRRQKLRAEQVVVLTPEQVPRLVEMVGRIAARRPEIFSEMIQSLLKKNPNVLLEVI